MTNAYLELARRCEEASGPDRELNADILEMLADERWRKLEYEASLPCGAPPDMIRTEARYKAGIRFDFTGSLDAAMSLAGRRRVEFASYENGRGWAYVHTPDDIPRGLDVAPTEAYAATLPLALCAASLRAKGAGENE